MATEAAFERDSLVMVTMTVRTEPTSKAAIELYAVRHRMCTRVTMVNSFFYKFFSLLTFIGIIYGTYYMDTRTSHCWSAIMCRFPFYHYFAIFSHVSCKFMYDGKQRLH